MSKLNLTTILNTPSKKNGKQWTGKYLISSKSYAAWHKANKPLLQEHALGLEVIKSITITIYPSTMAKGDLTNKAESIMDLLVDCGVLADDNWYVCPKVTLLFGGKDKDNPRAKISIEF